MDRLKWGNGFNPQGGSKSAEHSERNEEGMGKIKKEREKVKRR